MSRRGVIVVWLVGLVALVLGAGRAVAAPVPCHSIGGGKYNCSFYPAGDGISGGAPVLKASGKRVGYLNQGTNFVYCQAVGREARSGTSHNKYWAYTEANDKKLGWVNAVWAHGGTNDAPYGGGVPTCAASRGHPPQKTGPGSNPAPTPTPTPQSTPVPCHAIGSGKYNCSFYPAGNGISGGAPVLKASGKRVGYLNQGTNFVYCQAVGREAWSGPNHNKFWGYTEANDKKRGWVDAVWAHGGTDDAPFGGGVPTCSASRGHPPGGTTPPKQTKPKPKPARFVCHPYEIFGLRGSGEGYTGSYDMNATVGTTAYLAIHDMLPKHSTGAYSIPYPAANADLVLSDPNRFFTSMDDGAFLLAAAVHRLGQQCPHTRVAIVGYSQGAGSASDGVRMLGSADRRRIAALVLFADVYSKGQSSYSITVPYFMDGAKTRSGHGIFGARSIPLPSRDVFDLCFDVDPVCESDNGAGTIVNAFFADAHTHYKDWYGGALLTIMARALSTRLKGH